MAHVRLTEPALEALAYVVCGDAPRGREDAISPYRTKGQLHAFALSLTTELHSYQSIADWSRFVWTLEWLRTNNGKAGLRVILEAVVEPTHYIGSPCSSDEVASFLNQYLVHAGCTLQRRGAHFVLVKPSTVALPKPALTAEYVAEMSNKCDERFGDRDFEGAISAARTLVEAVLNELETQLEGACGKYPDLPKQYRAVAKKLRVDPERTDLDQHFKQVVGGLLQVVDGLAPIRNKASDAHARVRKPEAHHAHFGRERREDTRGVSRRVVRGAAGARLVASPCDGRRGVSRPRTHRNRPVAELIVRPAVGNRFVSGTPNE